MGYTEKDLLHILETDFLLNRNAFAPGVTNNNMVDSMLICTALEREWTELFAKWVDNFVDEKTNDIYYESEFTSSRYHRWWSREEPRILEHYERVKRWIEKKGWNDEDWREAVPKQKQIDTIMGYAINY